MAFADTLFDNQSCFGCGFHKRCGRELASPLGVVCQPGANVEQSGFEAGAVALAGDDQAVKEDSGGQGKQVTPPGGRTAPLSLAAGRMHQNGGSGAPGGRRTPRPRRCRPAGAGSGGAPGSSCRTPKDTEASFDGGNRQRHYRAWWVVQAMFPAELPYGLAGG